MFKFITNLLFPPVCVICGADDVHFCSDCKAAVKMNCRFTDFENDSLDGLISYCEYKDGSVVARAIHSLKYEFIRELAADLGAFLRVALEASEVKNFVLCPVPLHLRRERWRGFNQARLLTEQVGSVKDLLTRVKYKKPQMELGREERLLNVEGAFKYVFEDYVDKNKPVILVDDVFTTGSTMRECAKALKAAGFRLVYALVIAQKD